MHSCAPYLLDRHTAIGKEEGGGSKALNAHMQATKLSREGVPPPAVALPIAIGTNHPTSGEGKKETTKCSQITHETCIHPLLLAAQE